MVVKVRNNNYKVNIENQGTNDCRVVFVYNKTKIVAKDYIPTKISDAELTPIIKCLVQREIYDYNKKRTMLRKMKKLYGNKVSLMPEE